LFVAKDRGLGAARLMFVSSDRTWPLRGRKPLTSAFDHILVGVNGPEPIAAVTCPEQLAPPLGTVQSGEHSRSLLTSGIPGALSPIAPIYSMSQIQSSGRGKSTHLAGLQIRDVVENRRSSPSLTDRTGFWLSLAAVLASGIPPGHLRSV
jgi:hypothetical protein